METLSAKKKRLKASKVKKTPRQPIGVGRMGRPLDLLVDPAENVTIRNRNESPFQWLVQNAWLETNLDRAGTSMMREEIMRRFLGTVKGAEVSGLRSQAYERAGYGSGPRPVADQTLDCLKMTSVLRTKMLKGSFRLLMRVLVEEEWVWERRGSPKARVDHRDRTILLIHRAIDSAAVVFCYLTNDAFKRRWYPPKPAAEQSDQSAGA